MEAMLCFALLNNVGEAMKWQLKIESTEDDCYTLFFLDESRKKSSRQPSKLSQALLLRWH
jgi:hypothetical protein